MSRKRHFTTTIKITKSSIEAQFTHMVNSYYREVIVWMGGDLTYRKFYLKHSNVYFVS
jgi:hypothetical protein